MALLHAMYFLSAFCVGGLALLFRRHWGLALAGLEVGVGTALTPHRPEFANIGDLLAVLAIFGYGLIVGLVLLVPPRTRRLAGVVLLATFLIPVGCYGTAELRARVIGLDR